MWQEQVSNNARTSTQMSTINPESIEDFAERLRRRIKQERADKKRYDLCLSQIPNASRAIAVVLTLMPECTKAHMTEMERNDCDQKLRTYAEHMTVTYLLLKKYDVQIESKKVSNLLAGLNILIETEGNLSLDEEWLIPILYKTLDERVDLPAIALESKNDGPQGETK